MPERLKPWGAAPHPARFFSKKRGKKLFTAKLRFAPIFSNLRKPFPKPLISATAIAVALKSFAQAFSKAYGVWGIAPQS